MYIETEPHSGVCGFCETKVPTTASVCAGCGANWGLIDFNGSHRDEAYQGARGQLRVSLIVIAIEIALVLLTIVCSAADLRGVVKNLVPLDVIFSLSMLFIIPLAIASYSRKQKAKNGKLSWLRI